MHFKQDVDKLNACVEQSSREIQKLQAYILAHRGDREIKLNEMAKTIKIFSSRSDLHHELAIARNDLEAEMLVVHHLRADIDSYRGMLDSEHAKHALLQKEIHSLKVLLNSCDVVKSVIAVPGLNPFSLIELFSGRIVWLESELKKSRHLLSGAKAISGQPNSTGMKIALPMTFGKSDESSSFSEDYSASNDADKVMKKMQSHYNETATPHWQSDVLRHITSPNELVEGLDKVLMSNKLISYENLVLELKEKNLQLEQMVSSNLAETLASGYSSSNAVDGESKGTTVPLENINVLYEKIRIERNSCEKRLELCQISLHDMESELGRARNKVIFLEQTVVDLQAQNRSSISKHICSHCGQLVRDNSEKIDYKDDYVFETIDTIGAEVDDHVIGSDWERKGSDRDSEEERHLGRKYRELQAKYAETESLLRERTTQVGSLHSSLTLLLTILFSSRL